MRAWRLFSFCCEPLLVRGWRCINEKSHIGTLLSRSKPRVAAFSVFIVTTPLRNEARSPVHKLVRPSLRCCLFETFPSKTAGQIVEFFRSIIVLLTCRCCELMQSDWGHAIVHRR